MVLTDTDGFLTGLVSALDAHKEKGSVTITFRRSDLKNKNSKKEKKEEDYTCLVRMNDSNNKRKHSAVVNAKEHRRFNDSFTTILRAHTGNLKKRARTDRQKQKNAGTLEK